MSDVVLWIPRRMRVVCVPGRGAARSMHACACRGLSASADGAALHTVGILTLYSSSSSSSSSSAQKQQGIAALHASKANPLERRAALRRRSSAQQRKARSTPQKKRRGGAAPHLCCTGPLRQALPLRANYEYTRVLLS